MTATGSAAADRSPLAAYGCAVLSIVLATGLRWFLAPVLGDHLPFVTYFVAVMFTAWYAGLGPSLVAMGLGYLAADYLFVQPRGSFVSTGLANQLGSALYFFVGIVSALLSESRRQAHRRVGASERALLEKQKALAQEVAERTQAEEQVRQLTVELEQRVVERTGQLQAANRNLENEITERKWVAEELGRAKERFQSLVETIGDWIWEIDQKGRYTYVSPRIKDLLGYEPADLIGKTPFELMPPDESERVAATFEAFLSARAPFAGIENTNLHKDGRRIVLETSGTPIFDDEGRFLGYRGVDRDITERKKAEASLKKIEWLLTKKLPPEEYVPPYGNLLALNTSGEILRSVGESTLVGIVRSYLDLLGTSAAVYEKNGDYACGIFSSGWCRFMDQASRHLCGTGDNRAALQSGKWLCHESCWNDASKVSMETDQENDIPCKGGIRLYAVPIRAGEEVIGSLNYGYGPPPQDPQKLRELAEAYGVPVEQLLQLSRSYEAIPPFILDLAKKNARAAAQLIGDMVLRKRAESELKQSQEMLRLIVDNIPEYVFWKDFQLRYLGCNALFARSAGVAEPAGIVGKTDFDLAWKAMAERYRADDRSVIDTKAPKLNFEEPQARLDGSLLWLKTSKVPLIGRTGQVLGVLGIYEDITARKEMEARTSRLERLAAMGQLLGGIAHELKNPLFILAGYLQIGQEKLVQRQYEALAEEWKKIQDVAKRLEGITERFLRLALPVAGQQQRCSVPAILQNSLVLARNELEQNRIAVRADYAPDLPDTWLDAGQVREVFLNLITNAIQAMAEAHGRGTLKVDVQLSALSGQPSASEEKPSAPVERWIEVRIQDDGPGIPPELRTKIFEPFFTTKPPGKGTGLGLWVVRSNLMMLHGTVRVETETGKGATFVVQLPVIAEPSLSVDPQAPGSGRG